MSLFDEIISFIVLLICLIKAPINVVRHYVNGTLNDQL